MNERASIRLRLLNEYQHDFPLVPRPYAQIAAETGLDETEVLAAYGEELASGVISRIGAVVAPRRLGASTLAAMAVPQARMQAVAAQVSTHGEVNHNYEREGIWNLWFVVAAPDLTGRDTVLNAIATQTGLEVLSMPLLDEYHIDLGFDLHGQDRFRAVRQSMVSSPCALPVIEQSLLAALQDGLPLTSQPYAELGARAGIGEGMVLELLDGWLKEGLLKRFGVVVRHRELGYAANAMCVWDIPDDRVGEFGRQLAALPGVTLCYRRQRALPHWPYNLYCMIHGKRRDEVETLRRRHAETLGLDAFPHAMLFSSRCFKQCGARYVAPPALDKVAA